MNAMMPRLAALVPLKVRALFAHSRTIFLASVSTASGTMLGLHDFALPYITSADWTPWTANVPAKAWPLIVVGHGLLFGYLRTITDKSLADKHAAAQAQGQ